MRSFIGLLLISSPLAGQDREASPDAERSGVKAAGARNKSALVWKLEGKENIVYLAGSVHFLSKNDHPLPPPYMVAYERSARIFFEIPPSKGGRLESGLKMLKRGMCPPGKTVKDYISRETYKKLKAYTRKAPLQLNVEKMRPWMAALTISSMEFMAKGITPEYGLDSYFEKRARRDAKPTGGFESTEDQIRLFESLSTDQQDEILRQAIEETEDFEKTSGQMMKAWREGDAEGLGALMDQGFSEFPEISKTLLFDRNENWIAPIEKLLKRGENVMVIVGAGHLCGKDSVIDLLKKRGHKPVQMEYGPAPPANRDRDGARQGARELIKI